VIKNKKKYNRKKRWQDTATEPSEAN
jgi:hypothetical protein